MKIKNLKIVSRGFPWQHVNPHWASIVDKTIGEKYGWNPFNIKGMGRFGGGWAFKFGIVASASLRDVILELGIGNWVNQIHLGEITCLRNWKNLHKKRMSSLQS